MSSGMATSRRSSGRSAARATKATAKAAAARSSKPVAGGKLAKAGGAVKPAAKAPKSGTAGKSAASTKPAKGAAAKAAVAADAKAGGAIAAKARPVKAAAKVVAVADARPAAVAASKQTSASRSPASKLGKRESRVARKGNAIKAAAMISLETPETTADGAIAGPLIEVRRIHRRDINRVWEFLKRSFREVNAETVEYQRPRSKHRFEEIYEEEGVQQLLFEVDDTIVAYAECTYEVTGSDNWINPRYFEKRDMRPMFIDELAVHPEWNGRGVGSFVLEQLHHLARVNGLTHLVLEVAENNEHALAWYKKRSFRKLDAAIFMACALDLEPELLPPRALPVSHAASSDGNDAASE